MFQWVLIWIKNKRREDIFGRTDPNTTAKQNMTWAIQTSHRGISASHLRLSGFSIDTAKSIEHMAMARSRIRFNQSQIGRFQRYRRARLRNEINPAARCCSSCGQWLVPVEEYTCA
jgi:hypothetical protein